MGGAIKVILRITYALFWAILFIFIYWYTRTLMGDKYIEKYGNESLQEAKDYFFFYSRIPNYHKSEPIYTFSNEDFEIRLFETAQTPNDDINKLTESVFFMIHNKNDVLKNKYILKLDNGLTGEAYKQIEFNVVKYRTLDLFVAVNDEGQMIISKEDFLGDYTKMSLLKGETVLYTDTYTLSETDFTMKEKLESYYAANKRLPQLELKADYIFKSNPSDLSEYMYIFWVGLAIYFVSLIVITYFVFFFRRKYLGKEKPSVHFNNNN